MPGPRPPQPPVRPDPDSGREPIGLNCPECGTLAVFLIGDDQAFCGVDGCRILKWDPTMTRAEMLAECIHEIDLRTSRESAP
ncbi:MAG TPA: hypothetical protein VK586_01145 [Streptosporangiaceae bacterium]|nr:hypothetical protein [Streptosporangiaceae bacterium]